MKELTILLPLYKYDDEVKTLLNRSLTSFKEANKSNDSDLFIVTTENIASQLDADGFVAKNVKTLTVKDTDDTSFCHLINVGAGKVTTKYFSILEFDDEFTKIWFEKVEKHISLHPTESVILPLTEIYNSMSETAYPIGYINESVWASSFSENIGYFDQECLKDYMLFNATGGVYKTNDFKEIGMLKESIKLSFWFEFLLRAIKNDKTVYVYPKIGYKHYVNRAGSLSEYYNTNMSKEEGQWWIDLAKKEYLYKKDRKVAYEE